MPTTKKTTQGMATIDVDLVVIRVGGSSSGTEYAVDTANRIGVEPQTDVQEAIKLVKNGKLLAQKPERTTITGNRITLRDNVFIPDIVKILQGGKLSGTGTSMTYTPPVAGSGEEGEIFELEVYSAVYDESGKVTMYEKTTYPNCKGTPITVGSEDNVFRLPEYVINSAPSKGQAPYSMAWVAGLPSFAEAASASVSMMTLPPEEENTGLQKK